MTAAVLGASELLEKYNVPGPRYTSYPTVPFWDDSPNQAQWAAHLAGELGAARDRGEGAALYLHLPFCESLCTFCACNKVITKKRDRVGPYVDALLAEWASYRARLGVERLDLAEMHLGGGTPTYLSGDELTGLLDPILADCDTARAALSFEADPRVTDDGHLRALHALGFRRISMGIQDYDPDVQAKIHRVQSEAIVTGLTETARAAGFTSVNYDLIYGLPGQTLANVERTISVVAKQRPDRIAFYGYAHVPWVGKTGQRGFDENDLPSGAQKRALYERGRALLEAAGYVEIGLDHFALPDEALAVAAREGALFRNFMGYLPEHVSPLIGLGVSSIGDAWTAFAQNEKEVGRYQERALAGELPIQRGHRLTDEDLILRRCVLDVMTRGEADWSAVEPGPVAAWLAEAPARLDEMRRDGLVELDGPRLVVTDRGRPFLRNVAMAFDARLVRKQPQTRIFSQTV